MGLEVEREFKSSADALRKVKRELDARIDRLEQKVDRLIRILQK